MAEENATSPAIEAADVTVPAAAEPKKQRAPRQKKVAAETAAPVVAVKAPRKKRGEKAAEAAAAVAVESKPGRGRKAVAVSKPVKPAKATKAAENVASDEFADLIALEAENKSLRKELADKLKAENADLRKKLGKA